MSMGTPRKIESEVARFEAAGGHSDEGFSEPFECDWLKGSCCSSDKGEGVIGDLTWFRVGLALAFAGQGMVFGLGYNLALETEDVPGFGSPVYWALHGGLLFSALAVVALLGFPLIRSTVLSLKAREWTVEPLFLLTATGAMVASLVSSFQGQGSVYYEVVGLVLVIYTVGRKVGATTRRKALALTRRWQDGLAWAHVETPLGNRQRVPIDTLDEASVAVVLPEEIVTIDGRVLEGRASVIETVATGELRPVVKEKGDLVYAGSHVVDAVLKISPRLEAGGRLIDQILRNVDAAAARPSRFQSEADTLMRWFIPGVIAASTLTFAGWWMGGASWSQALFHSMAVLLVACPCALGLATPIAVWNGLLALSKRGLVSRDGRMLDGLAECDVWVFDKTGTLTEMPEGGVSMVCLDAEVDEEWLRGAVASLEARSNHPVALALQELCDDRREVSDFRAVAGSGVEGSVDGRTVRIGHAAWLNGPAEAIIGRTVYVEVDSALVARLDVGENVTDKALMALSSLRDLDCSLRILSGDPSSTGEQIAEVAVEGRLMPIEKISVVRSLMAAGHKTVFIGDGLNDAGAMAEASIGIAMSKGASLTQATATATLLGDNLDTLPWAVGFCRRLKRRLRGNLVFALSYNVVGILLAASGYLHPVVAAFLMLFSSLIVSWRAAHLVESDAL